MTVKSLHERVQDAEAAVLQLGRASFGDVSGHDFHGNQWTTSGKGTVESATPSRPDSKFPGRAERRAAMMADAHKINAAHPMLNVSPGLSPKGHTLYVAHADSKTWRGGVVDPVQHEAAVEDVKSRLEKLGFDRASMEDTGYNVAVKVRS